MNITKGINSWRLTVAGFGLAALCSQGAVAETSQPQAEAPQTDNVRQELEAARKVLLDAEKKAQEIILSAQKEALELQGGGHEGDVLSPLLVQNQGISIEISSGTLEEIVTAIMPPEWRVLVDVKDKSVKNRRFQFVSTRTREQALNDLLRPIGMKHQYFFDLKNSNGEASPLLVVSKER